MRIYKNDYTNLNNYSTADCGAFGKAFESCFTGKRCKVSGKVDRWIGKKPCEIKTGAGELGFDGKLLPKVRLVVYCPVVLVNAKGEIELDRQEAFFMTKENFLLALERAGAIRRKKTTAGSHKVTIQTFWNRKQDKPHGKLLYRILDECYELCDSTLEEMLEG